MNKLTTVFLLSVVFIMTNCSPYKQISLSNNDFYNNSKVPSKISKYDVYVHEGSTLYRLEDRSFVDDTLRGVLETVPAGTVDAHPEKRADLRASRKDMHVYLSKKSDELLVSDNSNSLEKQVAIDRKSVDRVDMFAKNEKHIFGSIGLVIALFALGALIVYALLAALVKGSSQAANNGSGSNSNSGTSDSGSGDSGGSDSGCYVATMVYGSYDAPNVLVLRSFRDRFLQRLSWGRTFISWYYRTSPLFVEKHRNKRILGYCIKACLNLFVWSIRPFFGRS